MRAPDTSREMEAPNAVRMARGERWRVVDRIGNLCLAPVGRGQSVITWVGGCYNQRLVVYLWSGDCSGDNVQLT